MRLRKDGLPDARATTSPDNGKGSRFKPGHASKGRGRPALPVVVVEAGPTAWQWIVDVALGVEAAEDNIRLRCAERVADAVYGAPGKTRAVDLEGTPAERVTMLENRATQAALDGDLGTVTACAKVLRVLAPETWGDRVPPAGDDGMIDVPNWVPLIQS